MKRLFWILLPLGWSSALWAASISQGEYFINADPGPGNGTAFTASGSSISRTIDVPVNVIAALPPGLHQLAVRVKDSEGDWSIAHAFPFYRFDPDPQATTGNIVAAEYYFDVDPGPGNGTAISITPGNTISKTVSVPVNVIAALPAGLHQLVCRVQDSEGDWSIAHAFPFYRFEPENTAARQITKVTYQWFQNGSPASAAYELIPDPAAAFVSFNQLASLAGLQEGGAYQLVFTPYDSAGAVGIAATRDVLVETIDSNGDGIPDQWAVTYGFGIFDDIAQLNSDTDSLNNLQEFLNQTNPLNKDSDIDGLNDDAEVGLAAFGFDPTLTQVELVNAFLDSAVSAGLYGRDQIGYLAAGSPVLERDDLSGNFVVNLALESGSTLSDFAPFAINQGMTSFLGDGSLDYEFAPPGATFFLILKAK